MMNVDEAYEYIMENVDSNELGRDIMAMVPENYFEIIKLLIVARTKAKGGSDG